MSDMCLILNGVVVLHSGGSVIHSDGSVTHSSYLRNTVQLRIVMWSFLRVEIQISLATLIPVDPLPCSTRLLWYKTYGHLIW